LTGFNFQLLTPNFPLKKHFSYHFILNIVKSYQHLKRQNLVVFFFAAFLAFSCNRFNRSYNEIPALPPADADFSAQHLKVLNTLIEDDDENDELYWQRSILFEKLGKSKDALEDIKKAIELNDEKYHYYKTLAQAYLSNNKYDSAIIAAEFSRNSGNDSYQLNLILGEAYLNKGDIKKSLEEIEKALQIDPNNYYSYYLRGMAYKSLNDTVSYKESFLNALTLNPEDLEVHKEVLNFYIESGDDKSARELLNKMFSKFTPDVDMLNLKAEYFEKHYRIDSAYYYYSKIVGADSSLYEVSLKLGNIKLNERKYSTALGHFKDVLKVKNDNFEAQYKLGFVYEYLWNYSQAIAEFEKAAQMDTLNQKIQADIARIKSKIYRRQEAERTRLEEERQRMILLPALPNISPELPK